MRPCSEPCTWFALRNVYLHFVENFTLTSSAAHDNFFSLILREINYTPLPRVGSKWSRIHRKEEVEKGVISQISRMLLWLR